MHVTLLLDRWRPQRRQLPQLDCGIVGLKVTKITVLHDILSRYSESIERPK